LVLFFYGSYPYGKVSHKEDSCFKYLAHAGGDGEDTRVFPVDHRPSVVFKSESRTPLLFIDLVS